DAPGVGRQHPPLPRGPRGSAEGQAVHGRAPPARRHPGARAGARRSSQRPRRRDGLPSAPPDPAGGGMSPQPGAPRSLDVVQRWFQAVVTHPEGVEGGVESEEAQRLIHLKRAELEAVIGRSRNLTAAERLGVCANASHARLLECLAAFFPLLQKTLGEEVFDGFAFEYLQHYPSKSYTLDRLGESFARFLEETRPEPEEGEEPGALGWPDFLIDLTLFEWNLNKVFDGPGVEGATLLTAEALQSFPAERFAEARLVPVPCLRLLA